MKKVSVIILTILFSVGLLCGQKTFENKKFGFSMQEPKDWIVVTNEEILNNLNKFELTEANLSKMLATNKGAILLTAYYKYEAKTHAGLIPAIQVNVLSNNTKTFQQFKTGITRLSLSFKTYFSDFVFIQEPADIEISKIKSVYFIGKFSMKTQNGDDLKARSRTYAIPYKNYWFQVNFNDGQVEEDSTEIFDKLLKTIKVGSL